MLLDLFIASLMLLIVYVTIWSLLYALGIVQTGPGHAIADAMCGCTCVQDGSGMCRDCDCCCCLEARPETAADAPPRSAHQCGAAVARITPKSSEPDRRRDSHSENSHRSMAASSREAARGMATAGHQSDQIYDAVVTTDRRFAVSVFRVLRLTAAQVHAILTSAETCPPTGTAIAFVMRVCRAERSRDACVVPILFAERQAVLLWADQTDLLWLSRACLLEEHAA